VLGLPDGTRGCLFDLDGVITKTAKVHNAAWKEMFDSYLRDRSQRTGEPFVPFDPVKDYDEYVDGKPRADGTRSFLASRGIELPEGSDDDPPGAETVHGLGTRKNEILLRRIRTDGVEAYDSSVRYVHAVRDAGLRAAVVSSSANCRDILHAVGIEDLFEARIDGEVAKREHLRGKPARAQNRRASAANRFTVGAVVWWASRSFFRHERSHTHGKAAFPGIVLPGMQWAGHDCVRVLAAGFLGSRRHVGVPPL